MLSMNRLSRHRRFPPFFRAFGAALLLAVVTFAGPADAAPKGLRQMTPEQRRDAWERMTPQQRQQWRDSRLDQRQPPAAPGAPPPMPDHRSDARGHISPDERQAMRQRFHERQQTNRMSQPDQNMPQRRQLSPEERQQLREQVQQARRNIYRGADSNPGANK